MNDIGVVIVTFNSGETIKKCLSSVLENSPGTEIIVVDNNSSDNTVEIIKSFREKVMLIEAGDNLGFSKSNNLGASFAKSSFLVFLNPDTEILQKGSLEKLRDVLVENPGFGLIGPKLIYLNGNVQKSVRNLPAVSLAFKEYILGKKGSYGFYIPEGEGLNEVESLVGACMIIRKETFKKAGRFSEKYFLYYEDLELCKSVRKLSLKVGFYPKVEIRHFEGISGKGQNTNNLLIQSAKRYHDPLEYFLIQTLIRIGRKIHG